MSVTDSHPVCVCVCCCDSHPVCVCHCLSSQNSGIEKAFLFDVVSKIYIATDSSPVDMQSYELCCDMIDVVIDVSCIYGSVNTHTHTVDNSVYTM